MAVVHCKNLITGQGPGTTIEFALKIAENLWDKEQAEAVGHSLILLDWVPETVRPGYG